LEKIDFEAPAAGFIGSLPLPTANKALEPIIFNSMFSKECITILTDQ
jgi:hypothetical protein